MMRQYCSFTLGRQLYGVAVERVQEVLGAQAMTAVPLAPPSVRGLINLRGEIVPAIDLRSHIERMPSDAARDVQALGNVVLRTDEGPFSLLVDRIGDVLALADEQLEPPPAIGELGDAGLPASVRALLIGVYQLPDALLLVDPRAVLELPELQLSEQRRVS